jgi:ligand-binding SRPBCC domain-containing protein
MSLSHCWCFFSSPRDLEKITPPAMNFTIENALPAEIYPGLMIEYTGSPLLGIPLTRLTEIVQVDAPHRFFDEQRVGPEPPLAP